MAFECSDSNIFRPLKCVSTREEHIIRAVDLSIAELTAEKSLGGTKKDMTQKRYCLNSSETPLKACELRDFRTYVNIVSYCSETASVKTDLHYLQVFANKFNERH
jgi:hypothetical protein